MAWILAYKIEMTRVIKGDTFVPVTLLKIPKIKVVNVKVADKDWYNALVLWISIEGSEWVLKADRKSLSFNEFSTIRELPLLDSEVANFNVWDDLGIDFLEWRELVELTSISKWKWFAWAMARHNFHGWPATHGSKFHRALWSIGNRKPRRTHKGKKMHWHDWCITVTLKKVPVELINKDLSVVWVRWPVPGARNSLVILKF